MFFKGCLFKFNFRKIFKYLNPIKFISVISHFWISLFFDFQNNIKPNLWKMKEWKVLKQEFIELKGNNFIEISLKEPPKEDELLIAISKGWIRSDGKKLYKANILFPVKDVDKIIEKLNSIKKD